LPDHDTPGKTNLVVSWKPINPLFNIFSSPGLESYIDPTAKSPGWELRLGIAWVNTTSSLPVSGYQLNLWEAVYVGMPAHLSHFVIPWYYVDFLKQKTEEFNQAGMEIHFQSRAKSGNVRGYSNFWSGNVPKLFSLYRNYANWDNE